MADTRKADNDLCRTGLADLNGLYALAPWE